MQDLLKWKHSQSWGLLCQAACWAWRTPRSQWLYLFTSCSLAERSSCSSRGSRPFLFIRSARCGAALHWHGQMASQVGASSVPLGTSPSTLHPEGVPKFLVNFTSRPKGFQSFLSALCSAECFVITSYKIEHANLATFLPSVLHWQDIFLSCKDQLGNSPDARFALLGGPAVSPGLSLIHSLF